MCVQYTIQLLEALVARRTAPNETFRKLDMIATGLVEQLRVSSKQVNSCIDSLLAYTGSLYLSVTPKCKTKV